MSISKSTAGSIAWPSGCRSPWNASASAWRGAPTASRPAPPWPGSGRNVGPNGSGSASRIENGGVTVALGGERWDGTGLNVETSNGGVTLRIPATCSAQLETQTVNGCFRSNYPLTVTGELSPRRGVSATLGSGGPPVKVRTRNGGVSIDRR
jgi:hypothetical protein